MWRSFVEVKAALRKVGIKYSMMFPAQLRVITDGKTLFFKDPPDAWNWMEKRPRRETPKQTPSPTTVWADTDSPGPSREPTEEYHREQRPKRGSPLPKNPVAKEKDWFNDEG